MRAARVVRCAFLCLAACALLDGSSAAQDWFRQRTADGRSIPVTIDNLAAIAGDPAVSRVTATPSASSERFNATGLPLAIQDNNPTGVTSTLAVPARSGVSGVTVSVNITHTFPADLIVTLTPPGGSPITLSNRTGTGSALVITDRTVALPATVQGNWSLKVADVDAIDTGQLVSWSIALQTSSSTLIDLTISMISNPTGDDDGKTQGHAGSQEQDRFERIVGYFADAVWEMTEGAHKIRQVRLFRRSANFGVADIRWADLGRPRVPGGSGVGAAGGHVLMFERFEHGDGPGVHHNMLTHEKGGGYIMAHEWGHFFLGLGDEYANACNPIGPFVDVVPSMMANPWQGEFDASYLNFSIKHQGGAGGAFQNTLQNCHHYAYGASAWEVLARAVSADPTDHAHRARQILGPRIFYPELAAVAPTGANTPRIDTPASGPTTARSALDIIWMKTKQNVELVIDQSGSMSGLGDSGATKQANAILAAKLLVNQARLGDSRIGITIFDDQVSSLLPLTAIDTEANRAQVKAALDTITPSGATAIGDAAASALAKMLALTNAAGENKVVFLLTDGQNNSGVNPLSVVPGYASAHIPLFTLGFGSDVDSSVLSAMATQTGGRYFFSPTTLGQITAAFQAANQAASSSPGLGSGSLAPTSNAPAFVTVPVNPSLDRVQVSVVVPVAVAASAIRLTSPAGASVAATSTTTTSTERLLFFDVDRPAVGNWQLQADTTAANKTVTYSISGSQSSIGYNVATGLRSGSTVIGAPGPVIIDSRLTRRNPIAGATVRTTVTEPSGVKTTVSLFDDGVFPDQTARDGTYSGSFIHSGIGDYSVTVEYSNSGSAVETYNGGTLAPDLSGKVGTIPADTPVTESFVRSQTIQFTVQTATTTLAPSIIGQPSNQEIASGGTVSFAVAATGAPVPTYQWQRQPFGSTTFTNLPSGAPFSGVTSATLTITGAPRSMAGDQFRCVVTNSSGSVTSSAVSLNVTGGAPPTMTISASSLRFGAIAAAASFTSQTPAQVIRIGQLGAGAVAWTATASVPWLTVTPASGTGPATLTVATRFAANLAATQAGLVALTFTGAANTVGPITATLAIASGAPASPPFGIVDTPSGDATVLAGSIAVTGWALDNIGVSRVELWRDLQPGETTPPFASTPTDPRTGKVFVANATFVDGARPDIENLYATTPMATRGGWGYLLLTWGLWNQGNGTYKLYAFAFDEESNVAGIGSKTIVVSNATATRPFGSIDTPLIGGDPGTAPNFGWALTPKVNGAATCKVPSSGVQVSIDSGPLQPVVYGDVRSDIAGAFPGFSNTSAAGGHFIIDWSTLTSGPHTIGWLVTDDCNRADGIGSRFFNVSNGTNPLTAAADESRLSAAGASASMRTDEPGAIVLTRGYNGGAEIVTPGPDGVHTIEMNQGDRIELRVPPGYDAASQVAGGQVRSLPLGSTWDAASGTFYWQPAPVFLGTYRLVFSNGRERITVSVVINPRGQ